MFEETKNQEEKINESLLNKEVPEQIESGDIYGDGKDSYKNIGSDNRIYDEETGVVIDPKDLSPLDRIKYVAKRSGVTIIDPNPNCTKSGCYGRGYTGLKKDTGEPVPCMCIFPKELRNQDTSNMMFQNYKRRRKLKQLYSRKSFQKSLIKENEMLSKMKEKASNNGENLSPVDERMAEVKKNVEQVATDIAKKIPIEEQRKMVEEYHEAIKEENKSE